MQKRGGKVKEWISNEAWREESGERGKKGNKQHNKLALKYLVRLVLLVYNSHSLFS